MARTLSYYLTKAVIVNNDIRYMPVDVKIELESQTKACSGDVGERLHWLRNSLTSYPSCLTCKQPLTSASYVNNVKGYRSYCSRACMRNSDAYKLSYKSSCLAKYGTEHSFSNEAVQAKRRSTNLERYGDEHPGRWSSDVFKERMLEKHGASNPLLVPDIRRKVSDSLRKSYIGSGKLDARLAEIERLEQVVLIGEYTSFDSQMTWKHSCGEEFTSNLADGKIPSCPKCYGASRPEYELFKLVESIVGAGNVVRRDRSLISPLELDIYVPSAKLAIELDGVFYHTELFLGDKAEQYHADKTARCDAVGVRLLHVFDTEWYYKRAIVEGKIRSALQASPRLFARKLKVKTVDSKTARDFLEAHHMQGADKHARAYGLYSDKLEAIMTFSKPRFSKKHDWELSRYASSTSSTIVGGASRLLAAFKADVGACSLVSYADARYSSGNLYTVLGFTKVRLSPPNYWYIKGDLRLSRYQTQKHLLARVLGSKFDPCLTEAQNMARAGWHRLYDCGSYVFEMNL